MSTPKIPGVIVDSRRMNKNFTLAAGRTDLKQALAGKTVLISAQGSGVYDQVVISEYNYKGCGKKIYARRTDAKPDQRFKSIKPGTMVDILVVDTK